MQSSHAENLPDSLVDPLVTDRRIVADARPRERDPIPILRVDRSDLTFRFEASGMVDIRIRVSNPGPGMSPPRRGRIEQAAFGAFLPWVPLTFFTVPPLRPGESALVELWVPRVALGGAEPPNPPAEAPEARAALAEAQRSINAFRRRVEALIRRAEEYRRSDEEHRQRVEKEYFRELLGLREEHVWSAPPTLAGNLNVHIGATSVERHLSGPLRLYPGQTNIAMFFVGTGRDAYRYHLQGEGVAWGATLHQVESGDTPVRTELTPGEWYEGSANPERIAMSVIPPLECGRGALAVHVEQRSTGSIAIVEFDLDPNAREAGCYTV